MHLHRAHVFSLVLLLVISLKKLLAFTKCGARLLRSGSGSTTKGTTAAS